MSNAKEIGIAVGSAVKSVMPAASRKTEDTMAKIVFGIVLLAIAYILYQWYKGIKYFGETISTKDEHAAIEYAVPETTDKWKQYFLNMGITPKTLDNEGIYGTYLNETYGVIPATIIEAGNLITPDFILEKATTEGQDFRQALIASGDNQRYEDLNPIFKALVTTGEALSRTFTGISPYELGQEYGDTIKSWFTW